jgi:hypothetical protein
MLQVFIQMLHVFDTCFPYVSDVCCKCFNCFGHMLQIFFLNIAKVDLVLYLLQLLGPRCMLVGVEGARAASVRNRACAN